MTMEDNNVGRFRIYVTRRSKTDFLGFLNKTLVTYDTNLQADKHLEKKYPGVTMSTTPMDGEPLPPMITTTGAEYMTLSLTVKELI